MQTRLRFWGCGGPDGSQTQHERHGRHHIQHLRLSVEQAEFARFRVKSVSAAETDFTLNRYPPNIQKIPPITSASQHVQCAYNSPIYPGIASPRPDRDHRDQAAGLRYGQRPHLSFRAASHLRRGANEILWDLAAG